MSWVRRALAWMVAWSIALAPVAAHAKPPAAGSSKIDKEIYAITARAEALLNDLEYERAREMLEESVRNARYRTGSPKAKGRLWVLLGRARAELGNTMGMEEAFLEAVRWDRRVRLSKSTSPKILDALERARANAPIPGDEVAVAPPPPRRRTKDPDAEKDATKTVPKRPKDAKPEKDAKTAKDSEQIAAKDTKAKDDKDAKIAKDAKAKDDKDTKGKDDKDDKDAKIAKDAKAKDDKDAKIAKDTKDTKTPKDSERIAAKDTKTEQDPKDATGVAAKDVKPSDAPPPKEPPRPKGPWLDHVVRGSVAMGETVTLIVKRGNLPKGTKVEALVKRTQTGAFKPVPLTASGTVSIAKIQIDRPKIDVYVRAVKNKKVIAQIGSELEPIVLSSTPPPPSLAEAWSEAPPPPPIETSTATVATTTTVARSAPAEVIAAPPPPAVAGGGLSDLEIGLIAGGAGVIVVTVAVVVIVLATRKSNCNVEEGFGCVEVQVLPLMRF